MTYPLPSRPALIERSALAWWLAFSCWFAGSALGQFAHGPAAVEFSYRYATIQPGPLAIVLFGIATVFLASLVLPMRDGARWCRLLLTVLAVPLEVVFAWQAGRSLLTGPATDGSVGQGLLSLVAFCAVPWAAGMMYRQPAERYFNVNVPTR
jgi:hypothetical protein